jgi:hypothetical protein
LNNAGLNADIPGSIGTAEGAHADERTNIATGNQLRCESIFDHVVYGVGPRLRYAQACVFAGDFNESM